MTRSLTVTLDPPDYECLGTQAGTRGMRPSDLARELLTVSLNSKGIGTSNSVATRLAAIERLSALAEDQPLADAVQLVQEAREDLRRWSRS